MIRVVAAGGAIVLCLVARFRSTPARAAEYLLSFSALYILLFNPRTENNTYAMLGPVIGLRCSRLLRQTARAAAAVDLSLVAVSRAGGRGRAGARLSQPRRAHLAQALVGDRLFALSDASPVFPRAGPAHGAAGNRPIRERHDVLAARMADDGSTQEFADTVSTTFDRYLIARYLQIFVILFVSMFGLFVVIDGFSNVDEFQEHSPRARRIC